MLNPAAPDTTGSPGAGGGTAASAQRSTMTVSIAIPARKMTAGNKRATKTISPGTAYVDVVLQSLNGNSQPVDGPYSVLIPVSQLNGCYTGGRSHGRSVQALPVCSIATVPAPVGNDVYAIAALDSNMTLLDYAENVPVDVMSSGSAVLSASLDGVGSGIIGYSMLTDPSNTTTFRLQNLVDCPANAVQQFCLPQESDVRLVVH